LSLEPKPSDAGKDDLAAAFSVLVPLGFIGKNHATGRDQP
jgi:hypothetical protein